ncbi:hypothetical protein [Tenacibaculum piscium]|uniref:hypothetical protein n=1 Tax=Tenacibaculum piscium TaxID=1458515 RepID=UPI00187B9069|nr:hypothetical protein [Tenacibaculum piscium]MBE7671556.1 hypothetical protein [Tenacibaculum piscium]MBE7690676.1 hypothetical protein [Tenacibaculum piscium]
MLKKILLIITLFVVFSCAVKKTKTTSTSKIEVVKKTEKVVENKQTKIKSLPINDTFFISLNTNDKKLDSIVKAKFKHFETSKKSGKNSYIAVFDTVKNGIKINTIIDSTANITSDKTIKEIVNNSSKSAIKKETSVKKYGIRWYWWLFLLLAGSTFLYIKFFNPFKFF